MPLRYDDVAFIRALRLSGCLLRAVYADFSLFTLIYGTRRRCRHITLIIASYAARCHYDVAGMTKMLLLLCYARR